MQLFLILLIAVIVFTAIRTFSNSIARQKAKGADRLKHQSGVNIHMGILFIAVAVMQGVSLGGGWIFTLLWVGIGALGIYNLIFGLRTRKHYLEITREQNDT
ncbi:hypothetical protein C8P63_104106 [Melghirimyces profundicolus]|uniref:YtpI-like protein n=1 Tax=Melghirimyces profundicolus TaxID=1242148 RepID=A0A2T6C4L4_9BACL|nr:hypothetical protein [Melghirimyces profundicolus]PTX63261.1 hypothetical protein C8P63_104106 [Melghirimyces profundicolus]